MSAQKTSDIIDRDFDVPNCIVASLATVGLPEVVVGNVIEFASVDHNLVLIGFGITSVNTPRAHSRWSRPDSELAINPPHLRKIPIIRMIDVRRMRHIF